MSRARYFSTKDYCSAVYQKEKPMSQPFRDSQLPFYWDLANSHSIRVQRKWTLALGRQESVPCFRQVRFYE